MIKNDSINILELLGDSDDQPSKRIRSRKHVIHEHKIFIDDEIGDPKNYRDEIELLFSATENDEINVFINSGGGNLLTSLAIIEAIKGCEGMVRAVLIGECHSAATLIALNCHEIYVTEAAHAMFHTASFGSGGTMANVKGHADFSHKYIKRILDSSYEGFLTQEEMEDLYKGIELWMDYEEIGRRLELRQEFQKEKAELEEKAAKEASDTLPKVTRRRKKVAE